jgi:hypothetical protein
MARLRRADIDSAHGLVQLVGLIHDVGHLCELLAKNNRVQVVVPRFPSGVNQHGFCLQRTRTQAIPTLLVSLVVRSLC